MDSNKSQILSKIATNNGHGENSEYFDGWKAYDTNPYHPTNNPSGVIQMGLAENQLSFDLVKEWMLKNPQASICNYEGVHKFMDVAIFQDYHGLPEFRRAIAKFMEKGRGNRVKFNPDRIVMSGGATGANETIMFCLADPGDAFLIPSPFYPAFYRDLGWRTGVKLIPVHCQSSNNFKITKKALELAYEEAKNNNIKVKGLIFTNPSNPLGTFLDKDTLRTLVTFTNDKRIHLVCDEIYAATVFGPTPFTSVAEVVQDMPHIDTDLIHVIYSLSKDMGMPGFRVGIVYSFNDQVVNAARRMSSFGLVSTQTQYMLAALLSDETFVDKFLAKSRERLFSRHHYFTSQLAKVGIRCLKSNAGLFVWMDLRHLMEEQTIEGELKLWRVIINEVKINVSPGSSFHCREPGWFRVCFANMDDSTLEVALERIRSFVIQGKMDHHRVTTTTTITTTATTTTAMTIKKKRGQMELRLSSTRYDEGIMMSPRGSLISPHSPIPQSPLVKART
nr:1-aminocyclopropane-1-carboxylic acid synthase [Portulaca umbraticola]